MRYVGVDPGKGGGIAVIDGNGDIKRLEKMPSTEHDLLEVMRSVGTGFAMLEEARAFSPPGMRIGAKSLFQIGFGYGQLRLALGAAGIPFDVVHALKWQLALRCKSGGNKNVTKGRAQELYPSFARQVTHWNADALLLAEYCRRVRSGGGL